MSRRRRRVVLLAVLVVVGAGLAAGGVMLIQASSGLTLTPENPVGVNTSDQFSAVGADNSPSLASDPLAPDHVAVAVRVDRPDFTCSVYASANRGKSWLRGRPSLPAGVSACYTPALGFAPNGDLYLVFLGLTPDGSTTTGTYIERSTDGGLSFAPPVRVAGADTLQPRVVADQEHVYVAWLDAGPLAQRPLLGLSTSRDNPLLLAGSRDGGATFAPAVRINPPSRPHAVGAGLAVLGGTLFISYLDLRDDTGDYGATSASPYAGPVQLVVAASSDGGRTIAEIGVAEPDLHLAAAIPVYLPPSPSIAADTRRNQVYVAYANGATPGGTIMVRRSSDGGHSWQPAIRVDSGAGTERLLPTLAVAPGSRVECAYYVVDGSARPSVATVGYVLSTDGGASFSTERDLLSRSFAPGSAPTEPRSHQPDLGDRLALAATTQWSLLVWADSEAPGNIDRQMVDSMILDIHGKGLSLSVTLGKSAESRELVPPPAGDQR